MSALIRGFKEAFTFRNKTWRYDYENFYPDNGAGECRIIVIYGDVNSKLVVPAMEAFAATNQLTLIYKNVKLMKEGPQS